MSAHRFGLGMYCVDCGVYYAEFCADWTDATKACRSTAPTSATNAGPRPVSETSATDGQHLLAATISRLMDERAALKASNEALRTALAALVVDVQDEHEADCEGFIVACHVPYGDVLRARALLDAAPTAAPTEKDSGDDQVASKNQTSTLSVMQE